MAKRSEFQYVLHPRTRKKDHVLTIIDGEHVDLVGGGVTVKSAARRNRPEKEIEYKPAKEHHLKKHYERGVIILKDGTEHSNQKIVIKIAREIPPNGGSTTE